MKGLSSYQKTRLVFSVAIVALFGLSFQVFAQSATTSINTSIRISVCGDALVTEGETCDNGTDRNNGQYSITVAASQCYPGCVDGPAPYCGDEILQPFYGETCDDGNNVSDNGCDPTCKQEVPPRDTLPQTGGGTPSGGGFGSNDGVVPLSNATQVILEGLSYPGSFIHILQDGKQLAVVPTNLRAGFSYSTNSVTPGPVIFGFWAEDVNQLRSITQTATFHVVQSATTNVSGIYLSPTIETTEKTLKQNETLHVYGSAIASSTVSLYFNSETIPIATTQSGLDGKWSSALSVLKLANEKFHAVKAMSETVAADGSIKKSGASQLVGFYVGSKGLSETVSPDINRDGKVNIIDFSMLLFYWGTSEVTADFNRDGKVDLTDFSIMLFAWTG